MALTGCTVCQNLQRTMRHEPAAYSWKHDRKLSNETYRRYADQAWFEAAAECPDILGDADYSIGFHDGFVDYVDAGGTTEPPPVPPRQYWNAMLRSPEGKQRADQWSAGYRHGAQLARDGGYRELGTIRSTLSAAPEALAMATDGPYESAVELGPEMAPVNEGPGPQTWESDELPLPSDAHEQPAPPPPAEAAATSAIEITSAAKLSLDHIASEQRGGAQTSATPVERSAIVPLPALKTSHKFRGNDWVQRGQSMKPKLSNQDERKYIRPGQSTRDLATTGSRTPDFQPPILSPTVNRSRPTKLRFSPDSQSDNIESHRPADTASKVRVVSDTDVEESPATSTVVIHLETDTSTDSRTKSMQALHLVEATEEPTSVTVVSASRDNGPASSSIRVRPMPAAQVRESQARTRDGGPVFRR